MIQVRSLTKRYGATLAVDDLSFDVRPGVVTGFLGPNGAGKSTTMRMLLGLDHPSAGTATFDGRGYADLPAPLRQVGALLDARALQAGRTARAHLGWIACAGGIGASRVDEMLGLVGLADAADTRVGGFSLGMFQRLGIATALLGDPATLLLDEPGNGLDPEGIRWLRTLLRAMAAEGRTVLVSSHQMSEMQLTADRVVVIGRGRFVADMTIDELTAHTTRDRVTVGSPQASELVQLLERAGATIDLRADGTLLVEGVDAAQIGDTAAANGIRLHELTPQRRSLEAAFLGLTTHSVTHHAGANEATRTADAASGPTGEV